MKEIADKIASPDYDFLRKEDHLGENIILLTLGGSYAYGLNVESSDIDLRGVCLERPQELIGLSNFEQFTNKKTDTVIYGLQKMVKLLMNCNPNVIEILATEEDACFILRPEGELLRNNIDLFLSQRAAKSFGGYARSQLYRIQNAMARDSISQSEKEEHILSSIERSRDHIIASYAPFSEDSITVYVDESEKDNLDTELFIDVNLKHYPLRDFKNVKSVMADIIKDYDKVSARNSKKGDAKLYKHAMHLIRLLIMGTEVLEGRPIKTCRRNMPEYPLLMNIRNGKISFEEIFSYVDDLDKKFLYASKNTSLPKEPDFDKIEDLVMSINKGVILND